MSETSLYRHSELVTLKVRDTEVSVCRALLPKKSGSRRILLIHGNPSHLDYWLPMAEFFRGFGEVLAVDMPGFGKSPLPASSLLNLDVFSEVALAAAESVGWSSLVDVVGHSHGGAVTQTIGARFPKRVSTLVLLGSLGVPAHVGYQVLSVPGISRLLTGVVGKNVPGVGAIAQMLLAHAFLPDPVDKMFAREEEKRLLSSPDLLRAMVSVTLHAPCRQLERQAPRIQSPTLLIHGSKDKLVPLKNAQKLAGSIRPSELVVLENAGHMIQSARRKEVESVLKKWFTKH